MESLNSTLCVCACCVSEFSKLAMAPVWAEIMDKINPILSGEREGSELNLNRLHVVSGHDDTVAPLMASLGIWNDTAWPPYASMFLIEVRTGGIPLPYGRVKKRQCVCLFNLRNDAMNACRFTRILTVKQTRHISSPSLHSDYFMMGR